MVVDAVAVWSWLVAGRVSVQVWVAVVQVWVVAGQLRGAEFSRHTLEERHDSSRVLLMAPSERLQCWTCLVFASLQE